MTYCFGILVMVCQPSGVAAVDSFCQTYQRVIVEKGDGAIKAPLNVRKRLSANEVTYRCLCEGWTDPICKVK